jgi:asparagine synthase (glutamine-hydrolysing)
MCGIVGIARTNGLAQDADRDAVGRMLSAQCHRGPDGEGLYRDGPVVLGHRRLAIIDLSPLGAQPMSNERGSVWVTFNGEIYNYRELRRDLIAESHEFRSECDTEILVHGYEQWGIAGLLRRLRGMFAFALYDRERAQSGFLFLARDRLGIKPLYYTSDAREGLLAFASEVKALRRSGLVSGEQDSEALSAFLCLGSVPFPKTWMKDVASLEPGSYLSFGPAGLERSNYWDFVYSDDDAELDRSALADAVDRHLIADVPTGVFLSGGVDSAGLVAISASRTRLKTLTVTFEEPEFNEGNAAREFAEAFGTDHHEVRVKDTDFVAELPQILRAMDQPTADGMNTYFVSKAARQQELKVVLSGLGGDEVFLGYPHYHRLLRRGPFRIFARSPRSIRTPLSRSAALYGAFLGKENWRRFDYVRGGPLHEQLYLLTRGFLAPAQAGRLSGHSEERVRDILDSSFRPLRQFANDDGLDANRFNYVEMRRYLHDQLLRDSDVFSMAHSIELRVPYLDHDIVERCCRIAPEWKIAQRLNKPQLVNAVGHPLVRRAAAGPKLGFTFPFARWMRTHAGELEERAVEHTPFEPREVRRCWKDFCNGRLHWSRAWSTVAVAAMHA